MNALILSALLGVIMMYSGILLKQKSAVRAVAIAGMVLLVAVNLLEMGGTQFFRIDTKGMIAFDRFARPVPQGAGLVFHQGACLPI